MKIYAAHSIHVELTRCLEKRKIINGKDTEFDQQKGENKKTRIM